MPIRCAFLVLFNACLFISCISNVKENIINIDFTQSDIDSLEPRIEKIDYLKLQSPNGEHIGFVDQLIVENNRVYIMDINSAGAGIFIFTTKGEFINSIKAEFNSKNGINRFGKMIVQDNGSLLVLDRNKKRVNIYSPDGIYNDHINLPYLASSIFHAQNKDRIIIKVADPCDDSDCNAYMLVDFDGEAHTSFFMDSSEFNQVVSSSGNQLIITEHNIFVHATDQCLYDFNADGNVLHCFDFGDFNLPENYRSMPATELINEWFFKERVFSGFLSICGNDNFHWLTYNYNNSKNELNGRFASLVYFKGSNSWINIDELNFGSELEGRFGYFFPGSFSSGKFYGAINLQGGDIYSDLDKGLSNEFGLFDDLDNALLRSNESDNPILYAITLTE